jgi:hypothetical protein
MGASVVLKGQTLSFTDDPFLAAAEATQRREDRFYR